MTWPLTHRVEGDGIGDEVVVEPRGHGEDERAVAEEGSEVGEAAFGRDEDVRVEAHGIEGVESVSWGGVDDGGRVKGRGKVRRGAVDVGYEDGPRSAGDAFGDESEPRDGGDLDDALQDGQERGVRSIAKPCNLWFAAALMQSVAAANVRDDDEAVARTTRVTGRSKDSPVAVDVDQVRQRPRSLPEHELRALACLCDDFSDGFREPIHGVD